MATFILKGKQVSCAKDLLQVPSPGEVWRCRSSGPAAWVISILTSSSRTLVKPPLGDLVFVFDVVQRFNYKTPALEAETYFAVRQDPETRWDVKVLYRGNVGTFEDISLRIWYEDYIKAVSSQHEP